MPISRGLLNATFTPQTKTITEDGMGGRTTSWSDGTAFRGRLSSLSIAEVYLSERLSNDKTTVYASHKLFCDNQTITEEYRIRNSDSTKFYEVKGIINPSNSNHHLEILVLEIR